MAHSKLLVLTLALLGLAPALPAAASAAGWSNLISGTSTGLNAVAFSTAHPRDVAFNDATHGWAVGLSGVIHVTTNGGATWSAQNSGSGADLNGVACGGLTAVAFHGTAATTFAVVSAAQVTATVPAKPKYGAVKVTVSTGAGGGNAASFTAKR